MGVKRVVTPLAFRVRSCVLRADIPAVNLLDSSVYLAYEDHFARIIVPVRQTFNDLAAALLRGGDTERAREVMQYAHRYLPNIYLRRIRTWRRLT